MDLYVHLIDNIREISMSCIKFGDYSSLLQSFKGLCLGLVFMWGQAVVINDSGTHDARLDMLTRDYSARPVHIKETC